MVDLTKLAPQEGMIVRVVLVRLKDDQVEAFKALMKRMAFDSNNEAGCKHYAFSPSSEDPTVWYILEFYSDQKALDTHETAPYFQPTLNALGPMLAEAPVILDGDVRVAA